jgi:hypothetical protein
VCLLFVPCDPRSNPYSRVKSHVVLTG